MKNMLTFDWEEWNDTASMEGWRASSVPVKTLQPATERLLEMVVPHTATFFVLACHVKEHAALIRRISGEGHEIALHGLRHRSMSRYSPATFREDMVTAKKMVEDIIGAPVIGFRAPNFSMTSRQDWAWNILLSCGFKYDSSMSMRIFSGSFKYRELPIIEIPRSGLGPGPMALPIGGGAFLRAYPYALTRFWLEHLNRQGRPGIVYAHPWELERGWMKQPHLPWQALLVMGWGGATMSPKIRNLLRDFNFGSVREVLFQNMFFPRQGEDHGVS